MKIEREIMINLNFTTHERKALALLDILLRHLQEKFTKDIKLQSPDSGEILVIEELSRVRGILGMLHDNTHLREFE